MALGFAGHHDHDDEYYEEVKVGTEIEKYDGDLGKLTTTEKLELRNFQAEMALCRGANDEAHVFLRYRRRAVLDTCDEIDKQALTIRAPIEIRQVITRAAAAAKEALCSRR